MSNNIGALWKKKTKNGDVFMNGYIEINGQKIDIVCFVNKQFKEGDTKPYFNILKSEPRNQQNGFNDYNDPFR